MSTLLSTDNTTIFVLTETHLRNDINDCEILRHFPNYSLIRCDRNPNYDNDSYTKKGGVAIIYPSNICSTKQTFLSSGINESVCVEFKELNLALVGLYRSPNSMKKHLVDNIKQIDLFLGSSKMENTVLSGDMNFPKEMLKWTINPNSTNDHPDLVPTILGPTMEDDVDTNVLRNKRAQAHMINNLTQTYGLKQYVNKPTNGINALDLIYTNTAPCSRVDINPSSPLSDHCTVETNIAIIPPAPDSSKEEFSNPDTLENLDLQDVNWSNTLQSLDCENVKNRILLQDRVPNMIKALSKSIHQTLLDNGARPKKKHKKSNRTDAKVIHRIRHLRKTLNEKTLTEDQITSTFKELKECNERLIAEVRNKNFKEEEKVAERIKSDTKAFYRYVNSFKKNNNSIGPLEDEEGNLVTDPKLMAHMFNSAFSRNFDSRSSTDIDTIKELFLSDLGSESDGLLSNLEITTEDVLSSINASKSNQSSGEDGISTQLAKQLKAVLAPILAAIYNKCISDQQNIEETYVAIILPIYKKGMRTLCTNYRPIAKTSVISKLLERILVTKIEEHLIKYGYVSDTQYGFTKGKSIQMQMLRYTNFVMKNLKEYPKASLCTLHIDYSSAFQRVSHSLLLSKLRNYKITGYVGLWVLRWLTERQMCTSINGHRSSFAEVTSGVPEGSVAGPALFKIMIMDVPVFKDDPFFCILSFADDTHLSRLIRNEEDAHIFQQEIDEFYQWSKDARLKLNGDKFQAIVFRDKSLDNQSQPTILDNQRRPVKIKEVVNHLGILVDNQLNFSEELNKVIQKARTRMYWILRIFTTRKPEVLMPIFKSVVQATIDFPNLLTCSPSSSILTRLESIQRRFTSKLDGMSDKTYSERLSHLHLYSIQRRKDRGILLFMQRLALGDPKLSGFPEKIQDRFKEENYYVLKHSYSGVSKKLNKSWVDPIYKLSAQYVGVRLYNSLPMNKRSGFINNASTSFNKIKAETDKFLKNLRDIPEGRKLDNRLISILRPGW